jgi:hypothetical protein
MEKELNNKSIWYEVAEIVLYIFGLVWIALIIPMVFGFALGGFEESFKTAFISLTGYLGTFLIYIPLLLISICIIMYPIASLLKKLTGQDKITWLDMFTISYIFSPENGLLYKLFENMDLDKKKNPMRFGTNVIRVLAWSIIIFGGLGLLQVVFPQLNVASVPHAITQQISTGADIAFGAGIPTFAENGTVSFIFFFFLGINYYLCFKFIKDKKFAWLVFFTVTVLLICPLCAGIWLSIHNLVYSSSETAQQATFIFGLLGTVITILLGTMIPWGVWHFFNNFSVKLQELSTGNEDWIFFYGLIWVIFTVSTIIIEILLWRHRKKKNLTTQEF